MRLFELVVLRRPHLVLAHLGGDVAVVVLGHFVQALNRMLRFDDRPRLIVFQAIPGTPFLDLRPPCLERFLIGFVAFRFPNAQHLIKDRSDIANDRQIDCDGLVDR